MARLEAVLCAVALLTQMLGGLAVESFSVSGRDTSLRVDFGVDGNTLQDAHDAGLRGLIARLAGVPAAAVSGLHTSLSPATNGAARGPLQITAAIQTVNLAAPYARLSSASAPSDLAAGLHAIGASYSLQSLQVAAPAWVTETAQPAKDAAHAAKLRFVMSGVALPDLDKTRLRAVVGSVTGVRLEDVQVLSVEYAVAAKLGRRAGDGYHTLRVTAAVDAAAAATGSLRLAAEERPSLARILPKELGAAYRPGSLEVTMPPGALAVSPSFAAIADLHGWQAGCSSGLAAALLALAAAGCGLAVICCCQTKAASMSGPAGKVAVAVQWATPVYQKLPAGAIVGS